MTVRLEAVAFHVPDPAAVGAFWAGLLDRDILTDEHGVLVPGDERQLGLRFVAGTPVAPADSRLHLHVETSTTDEQREYAKRIEELGGRRRGSGELPFGRDLYMSDPAGHEFCVIEPANDYLAGCGPLAEVTADGAPATGRFWAEALGWAIVWDQDGQLVVQSPAGGTKIGYDRWALPGAKAGDVQRFDLVASDLGAEVDRLVALGAARGEVRDGVAVLTDPDGYRFQVRAD